MNTGGNARWVAAWITLALMLVTIAAPLCAQTVRYIHTDALGSVVAVTDANRNIIERREYEPYGAQLTPAISDGPGYTGHVQDAATGLAYMQQRYYDPAIGRFLSVDPVTASSATGSNFNRYRYANSNPYKFTDPDGRQSVTIRSSTSGASSPEERQQIKVGYKMVDLTVRGVKAGGSPAQIANLKKWNVTIDTTAESAPKTGGIMETSVASQAGELVGIHTTVSQRIVELDGTGSMRLTGAIVEKGSAALEFAGIHEVAGHGNMANRSLSSPLSIEQDASSTALGIMKADTAVQTQPIECATCYDLNK